VADVMSVKQTVVVEPAVSVELAVASALVDVREQVGQVQSSIVMGNQLVAVGQKVVSDPSVSNNAVLASEMVS
jgi:hypothetical protein